MFRALKAATLVLAAAASWATPSVAADPVKIGMITTLSGPQAGLGIEIKDGFDLAVKEGGGKLGGTGIQLVVGDDETKPDVARQLADKMIERDRVAIITGPVFSNVLLAIAKPVLSNGVFLLSPNAGPSELAGKQCNPNFFAVSWQNDNTTEALGAEVQQLGIKRVYIMAPNYPAGKDKVAGFKRTFKGEVVGEVFTQFGQLDYAAEIAQLRAARPEAVFVFYPGGMGINFIKQFEQAGLSKEIKFFGESGTLDETILPAVGEAALGARTAMFWNHGLDNPANQRFVSNFEKEYGRTPSPFAAQAYDTALLIASALQSTDGQIRQKDAFRAALKAAKFTSVRGSFRFNTNNFPIEDWYGIEVVKNEKGGVATALGKKILSDHQDAYVSQCSMK